MDFYAIANLGALSLYFAQVYRGYRSFVKQKQRCQLLAQIRDQVIVFSLDYYGIFHVAE
jgi:hypothetical protein